MMIDTLEMLLLRLVSMKERAQQLVAAEYPPDAVFDWVGEHRIWLALEQSDDGGWGCGWLIKTEFASEFVLDTSGRTPIEAALKLVEMMGET
jgi:hypothetical protein